MTRRSSPETREQAFADYVNGATLSSLAVSHSVHRRTIESWRDKGDWVVRRANVQAKTCQLVDKKLSEVKVRQLKILEGIQARFVQQLRDEGIDVKPSDLISVLKHELLLLGEAETSTTNTAQEKLLQKMEEWFGNSETK